MTILADVYQESRCEALVTSLDEIFATLKDNLPSERFRFFSDALFEKQLQAFANTINPHQVSFSSFCYFIYLSIILFSFDCSNFHLCLI